MNRMGICRWVSCDGCTGDVAVVSGNRRKDGGVAEKLRMFGVG